MVISYLPSQKVISDEGTMFPLPLLKVFNLDSWKFKILSGRE